jgi:hypothetical protein
LGESGREEEGGRRKSRKERRKEGGGVTRATRWDSDVIGFVNRFGWNDRRSELATLDIVVKT